MSWISSLFSRYTRTFHFVIIGAMSLTLIIGNEQVNNFTSGIIVKGIYYPSSKLRDGLRTLSALAAKRDTLALNETRLKTELGILREAQNEYERLCDSLGFEYQTGFTLVPARIIKLTRTDGGMPTSAEINKGPRDLVLEKTPVVTKDGLVGCVVDPKVWTATVQLLTDPASRVSARLKRSRFTGIVKYIVHQDKGMIMDYFPIEGDIRTGDTVISSGLGGVYPRGLMIGTVDSVISMENSPYFEVRLKPAANFHALEELFLLRWKSK